MTETEKKTLWELIDMFTTCRVNYSSDQDSTYMQIKFQEEFTRLKEFIDEL